MIIEPIKNKRLPRGFEPSSHARSDLTRYDSKINSLLMLRSREMWAISDRGKVLVVAGIIAPSLVGSVPELWLLTSRHLRARDAVALRRIVMPELLRLYPRVHVIVDWSFGAGVHFAKFFGFKPIDTVIFDRLGFLKMEAHVGV